MQYRPWCFDEGGNQAKVLCRTCFWICPLSRKFLEIMYPVVPRLSCGTFLFQNCWGALLMYAEYKVQVAVVDLWSFVQREVLC